MKKDKLGVYCFINNINGHTYVGSSIKMETPRFELEFMACKVTVLPLNYVP